MKVITVSENQVVYVGNGQTTSFGYNFKILNRSDLHLIRVDTNGNETAVTSDYYIHLDTSIVDYPGYAPGAEEPEVDRPLVLGRGEKLVIYRDVPITQESQMPTQWPFDVIEDAHDKSCMIDQQLQGQLDRSLKVARSQWTSDFNPTLPVQAGYGWRVSDDGKSIIALANPEGIYEQCEGLKSDVAAMKEATNSLLGLTQTAANTATAAASSANSAKTSAQASATAAANSAYDAGSKATIVESYYTNVAQAYDETEEYSAGDLVFVSNGDMYRALVDVSGEAPDSGYSWTKVQSNLMSTFEMDAAGDLMPRTAPQTSSIWDIDQNGDITPTAYGSGSETHGAEEQIIENQRNIAKLDATKADKTEIVDAYSKSEIDVQFATVNGDISELNSDIANCESAITTVGNNLQATNRTVSALWDMGKGILYRYETDSTEAYSKSVPSGAKVMDLKSLQSGKSFVENEVLVTVNVDKVVISGKNLFDETAWATENGYTVDSDGWINGSSSSSVIVFDNTVSKIEGAISMAYTIADVSTRTIAFKIFFTDGTNDGFYPWSASVVNGFTTQSNKNVETIKLTYGSSGSWKAKNIMVCAGTDKTYTPCHAPTTITLPTAIATGKSAGTVYDSNEFYSVETDGVTKYYCKHTQRVGQVDLGTLNWNYYSNVTAFGCIMMSDAKMGANLNGNPNGVCARYTAVGQKSVAEINNMEIEYGRTAWNIDGNVIIKDSAYTNATTFKSAMDGVMLYYELATPIVTTTELSQNLFDALTVEGGGSITFVGNNTDYHLPMANEEEYLVYLNEVSE